ncbi:MAG TPA: TldD/PmbA family protein [Candidatus Saccharimonadales bacterium]|nr:TldD/PmbA family protein [Candidatus Saccharimonadales bacterium]
MLEDSRLENAVQWAARRGASYADARYVERESETVSIKDGQVEGIDRDSDRGVGVRVLYQGSWGFAASDRLTGEAVLVPLFEQAIARAEAAATVQRRRVVLAPAEPQRGEYRTPVRRDPFAVPLRERVDLLRAADAILSTPHARLRRASVASYRTRKRLLTSEGTDVRQEITECGAGLNLTASMAGAKPATRSDMRNVRQAGWEYVEEFDVLAHARTFARDVEEILRAKPAVERPTTLLIDQPFLALLVHESCGHPTESDRVLEHEVAFAGTTFMWPPDRGILRYGSPFVNMTADATVPGGMGTFGWDDDGVPATRTPLVERGIFTGYLSSRETAGALGIERSGGCARAEGWQHFPIVRMVNVSLEPGDQTYGALLAGIQDGLLLESPASYSLDDKRQNFHFSTQVARVIRNGEVGEYVRGVAFQSLTPDFWGSCDGVADDWELHGFVSCAKGEPLQLMRVGHGAAHARFRDRPIEVRA